MGKEVAPSPANFARDPKNKLTVERGFLKFKEPANQERLPCWLRLAITTTRTGAADNTLSSME